MRHDILKSPGGMRSYLPGLASELKEIENKINDVFKLWGYQPIITPTLEYYDSLIIGMGEGLNKELYKFIDYEGNILVLRPEMTAPIARTLAGRLDDLSLPQRLSYNASIFRYGEPQSGKNREIYQAGVELIGERNALADAEAIIIAIESLLNTGIEGFKIDIGHAGFLEGLLELMQLKSKEKRMFKNFLVQRDLVGLGNYISDFRSDVDELDVLEKLPQLRGNQGVLEKAGELVRNDLSSRALSELQQIYNYLEEYGLAGYINFDLSLIRGLDYYTGVVFEGFTEKLGYTICGGGRYDHLIRQYSGVDLPAIGFAIGIERVRLALRKQGYQYPVSRIDDILVFNHRSGKLALKVAAGLRQKGITFLMAEREGIESEMLSFGKKKGADRLISFCNYPESREIEIYNLKEDKIEKIMVEEGWEEKLWRR